MTNKQVQNYLKDPNIPKVNYIGKINYNRKAEMIGFNKELSAYLWLVDGSYQVLETKR